MPVLDSGARGSTTTFVQRGIGDVLLAWENEAFLAVNELGPDQFDIVVPPTSIKAEPPVALVDDNVDEKGTREVAAGLSRLPLQRRGPEDHRQELLPPGQPRGRRSRRPQALPRVKLVSIDDPLFGGWAKVTPKFFADGGIFDQIYKPTD